MYLDKSDAVFLVYDVSQPDSLKTIEKEWIGLAKNKAHNEAMFVLVGTKIDCERRVSYEVSMKRYRKERQ